ncbi:MAG: ABC transporter ATP-binding protein/permease [Methanobrevibacter sp.]|nr:ABC transporter ATP-binding protein/permease [Methanobrevibacter sp.]
MDKILELLVKRYKLILIIIFFLILQAYLTLLLPQYTADIVDIGIANTDLNYIFDTGIRMILVTVLATIVAIIVSILSINLSSKFARDLRKILFSKMLKYSNHELNYISKSSLITRITNDVSNIESVIQSILSVIIFAPILGIGCIIKTMMLGIDMYWIILLVLVLIVIIIVPIVKKITPNLEKIQKTTDKINLVSREILIGMPVIKTFVKEDYEEEKFNILNKNYKKRNIYTKKYLLIIYPALFLQLSLMIVLIVLVGSYMAQSGDVLIGNILAFIQYATQIVEAFIMIGLFIISVPKVFVSINRVNEVLNTEVSITDGEIDTIDDEMTMEFREVSYKYPKSEKDTLTNINFKIEPRKTLAIIGGTGSGKSTILNLIPHLQDVSSGEIIVNGVNIKNYKLETLRNHISLTPQKAQLFQGTVRSNMTIIKEDASDDEIKTALEKASVDFIDSLDDEVSQDGSNFSGGQKQRLSIARSFLKECDVYIFDDCFSALDMNTERKIKKHLNEINDAAILIVSQKISTIKDADEIIVLDNGRIVDRGTHNELVENCKVYQEIVKSQLESIN